ncbi:hypothetical protein K488DRAFT_73028 [Vararia minispora EC-137]|uniref:Uncharacterized protein n=1 Tax=Vararia minispora EC-137 TaxID=1314806 RepID=A0ACB8QCK7_9AGAM|nr:hypothetical protein K488DRAFT_73028 [Vararia minispora EC-137]
MIFPLYRSPLLSFGRLHTARRIPPHFFRTARLSTAPASTPHTPTLREQLARAAPAPSIFGTIRRPKVLRHVLASSFLCLSLYLWAARETNDTTDRWVKELGIQHSILGPRSPTTSELRARIMQDLADDLNRYGRDLGDFIQSRAFPILFRNTAAELYVWGANHWLAANDGKRAAYVISAANLAVYTMWRIRRLRPFMTRHFVHDPLSGRWHTLFTSVFSHNQFWHLAFNTVALTGFASTTSHWMTLHEIRTSGNRIPEATTWYHFLAFYVAAGVFANLVSHLYTARVLYPRAVQQLARATTAPTQSSLRTRIAAFLRRPSASSSSAAAAAESTTDAAAKSAAYAIRGGLGASGAIYACVALTAFAFPGTTVSLVFFPVWQFDIRMAVGGILLLDLVGLLRGWRFFDHAAHLAGAAFGAWYAASGMSYWLATRAAHKRSSAASQTHDRPSALPALAARIAALREREAALLARTAGTPAARRVEAIVRRAKDVEGLLREVEERGQPGDLLLFILRSLVWTLEKVWESTEREAARSAKKREEEGKGEGEGKDGEGGKGGKEEGG